MRSRTIRAGVAATAALALATLATACGDDSDDAADDPGELASDDASDERGSLPADWDPTAYCAASLALETAPEPEVDWESMSPEEQAEAARQHATETMEPLVDEAVAQAPDMLEPEIDVMTRAFEEVKETGDFSVFQEPEAAAAADVLHGFDLGQCGWHSVQLTTTDYAFEGLPEEIEAGVTSFDLTNEGTEVHELALARKNDGVTASAEELVALPEEEAFTQVTPLGASDFAAPGEDAYLVVDLEPGEYVAVCFIPTGTTGPDDPPADGPPHAVHGMVAEFTVR